MSTKPENGLPLIGGMLNEWRFIRRQPPFWVTAAIALCFATLLSQGLALDEAPPAAQLQLMLMAIQMLIMPALVAALSPLVLLRDRRNLMTELIAATPIRAPRLAAIRALTLLALCLLLLLMAGLPALLTLLGEDTAATDTLPGIFVGHLLLYLLPNLLAWLALAQLLCRLGSGVTLYVVLSLAMLAYLYVCSLLGSPLLAGSHVVSESFYQMMLWLDPMHFTALNLALTSSITPGLYPEGGELALLGNRLLVLLFAATALVFGARASGVLIGGCESDSTRPSPSPAHQSQPETLPLQTKLAVALDNRPALSGGQSRPRRLAMFADALSSALGDRLSQLLVLIWLLFCANEVASGLDYAEPMAQLTNPGSMAALNRIMFDLVPVGASLLLALLCWQMATRPQRLGLGELQSAAPWRNHELLMAQWLAATALAALLLIAAALVTATVQWLMHSPISASPYLVTMGVRFWSLSLWAIWVLGCCHLLRSPLGAAGAIVVMLIIKYSSLMAAFGLSHPLWNITNIPLQPGDAYWGLTSSLSTAMPHGLFWLVPSVAIALLAIQKSHRGSGIRPPASRVTPTLGLWLGASCLAAVGFAHLALIEEKPLINSEASDQWRADYERRYKDFAEKPALSLTHLDAIVDFFPASGDAKLELTYRLINRGREPVTELLIGRYGNYPEAQLDIEGATLLPKQSQLGQRLYRWQQPVAPGESRSVRARISYREPSWWPANRRHLVKPGFSYLRGYPLIPVIGYQHDWLLADAPQRKRLGLPAEAPQRMDAYDWISIDSTVSSCAEQTPLAQGELVEEIVSDGRRTRRYQTIGPIRNLPAWLTVPGTPNKTIVGDVSMEIFATTEDATLLSLHRTAMTDTLSWFAANLSRYRGKNLSLVAIPELGMSGYALPQIILLSDKLAFGSAPSAIAPFDQRYRRTVHETAHQWFGHELGNGSGEQSAFLVESLTKYLELVLIEQRYGTMAMEALVLYEAKRYRDAERSALGKDPALIYALSSHEQYSGATVAFAALRSAMGDEPIVAALRTLWQQHAYPASPARAEDFVTALKLKSPEHSALIDELLLTPGALKLFVAKDMHIPKAQAIPQTQFSPNVHRGAFAPR